MSSSQQGSELRIVMIGKTGVGKSAVGNTILDRTDFKSNPGASSVTTTCSKGETTLGDRVVTVVDTPGILDTTMSADVVKREIMKCVELSCPGPHVFLLVMQIGRFTKEEKNSVEALQELFGQEANQFMIVLFTRGGDLGDMTIQEYVCHSQPELQKIIQRCGGRFHVFENSNKDRQQVEELFKKIIDMVAVNGEAYYTDEIYTEVENERIDENFSCLLVQRVTRFQLFLKRD